MGGRQQRATGALPPVAVHKSLVQFGELATRCKSQWFPRSGAHADWSHQAARMNRSAACIQAHWSRCVACRSYALCTRRLLREYNALSRDAAASTGSCNGGGAPPPRTQGRPSGASLRDCGGHGGSAQQASHWTAFGTIIPSRARGDRPGQVCWVHSSCDVTLCRDAVRCSGWLAGAEVISLALDGDAGVHGPPRPLSAAPEPASERGTPRPCSGRGGCTSPCWMSTGASQPRTRTMRFHNDRCKPSWSYCRQWIRS